MKTLILAAIRCSLMFLLPAGAHAISAQWDLDPISGDWNMAANWTPNGVPNGPADIATFGLSNTTNVSISEDTEVNSIIFTPEATNPYTITVADFTLTISGVGITNDSGMFQQFVTGSFLGQPGQIRFTNSSTAGSVFIQNDFLGSTNFFNNSTAGSSQIFNSSGATDFFDSSTAGSAFISNSFGSSANFFDRSTAGNSVIVAEGGSTNFFDNSTAGNARLGAGGLVEGFLSFFDNSTAGSASIFLSQYGVLQFANTSSAGSASIVADLGFVFFEDSSRGGTARIELLSDPTLGSFGILDISAHSAPGVTIGSIEGGGNIFLGANNLTVGSNNLSTTFSGVIQDGGQNGSLTKIGSGTLILSGANTYTGNTNVGRGVLQVDGSITSNTFVNSTSTLAGTGTIRGDVVNQDLGTVRPGGALGAPGVLTVAGNYTQTQYATLMIQIAGISPDQFSVLNVLGNANLNGFLDPGLLNGFVPTLGDSFVFLNYASFTDEFSHIKHRVFDNGMLQWTVIYEANHAILAVEQHVPDQGSTFLLLMLGLLGLVRYRRHCLISRKTSPKIILALTAAAALSLAHPASANLVTNPGFETGDLTGWIASGGVGVDNSNPHSGLYEAFLHEGGLSQTIHTIPGATYDFSMWFAHASPENEIDIYWNGSLIDRFQLFPDLPYFQLTYTDLIATESLTEVKFAFHGIIGTGTIYLDDVSVTRSGFGVPEPFSTLWLALPFARMVAFRRFRTKSI